MKDKSQIPPEESVKETVLRVHPEQNAATFINKMVGDKYKERRFLDDLERDDRPTLIKWGTLSVASLTGAIALSVFASTGVLGYAIGAAGLGLASAGFAVPVARAAVRKNIPFLDDDRLEMLGDSQVIDRLFINEKYLLQDNEKWKKAFIKHFENISIIAKSKSLEEVRILPYFILKDCTKETDGGKLVLDSEKLTIKNFNKFLGKITQEDKAEIIHLLDLASDQYSIKQIKYELFKHTHSTIFDKVSNLFGLENAPIAHARKEQKYSALENEVKEEKDSNREPSPEPDSQKSKPIPNISKVYAETVGVNGNDRQIT
ncbi:MAG: hypothetical protein K0R25_418 [Rickettsiaceae bacterium]|jgi:hypothetical protein|nr:hypothetical protein [Rickettsiaceae bacterium]